MGSLLRVLDRATLGCISCPGFVMSIARRQQDRVRYGPCGRSPCSNSSMRRCVVHGGVRIVYMLKQVGCIFDVGRWLHASGQSSRPMARDHHGESVLVLSAHC
ncbi:unnamed protein product [Ectocarpus fasciculatus]